MEKSSGPGSSPRARSPLTTIVQTDVKAFKELVQRLTGPNDQSLPQASPITSPAPSRTTGVRRPTFKLKDKRWGSRSKLTIMRPNSLFIPLMGFSSPSPSGLVSSSSPGNYLFSPMISPSTYLSELKISDEKSPKTPSLGFDGEEDEKAIKERRFFMHPSPSGYRPRRNEPVLLPLFPLTSPPPQPIGP